MQSNNPCDWLQASAVQVMGIVNVTPDSFSDGGRFHQRDAALRHAQQMLSDGAAIIDVGGESTRPGAEPVSVQQELDRVVPVIEVLLQETAAIVSVDTSTPEVIHEAARLGAHLINDVRALQREGALQAAADTDMAICLMHMQGEPQTMQQSPNYACVVTEVADFLCERVVACESAGISRDRMLLDPGFGFGKTTRHNYELLQRLDELQQTVQLPLLTGLSRKRMIGAVTGQAVADQRVVGSAAGALLCAMKGARVLRVHDVRATVDALAVWQASEQPAQYDD
ncbi:dihydropteroate synthase [Bacterioplanes sanyensis]|uniref:Dihydropteroate synthase n=1 Tax=Bacterioplanes sanyensis TaxID=1249553 RepID=A0A222FF41_9GAMM|nr:dihydropteroate synthase [Bacterioplanes sanyensis]ASP37252.1 dihydropteroate synthase [Bacterioplanes sanyensis]